MGLVSNSMGASTLPGTDMSWLSLGPVLACWDGWNDFFKDPISCFFRVCNCIWGYY